MAGRTQFAVEHISEKPRGWKVRTVTPPRSKHEVRIAFPPGRRHKGSGKVLEILHPKSENNPKCAISKTAKSNPAELLIFGNPSKRESQKAARERAERIRGARLGARPNSTHKAGCPCFACKHERRIGRANPRRRRRDRNPSETEQAVKLFESFHGHDARGVVEKQVSAAVRKDYAALGPLIALGHGEIDATSAYLAHHWEKYPHIDFSEDKVMLAGAPAPAGSKKSRQLYCIGGNQNLSSVLHRFTQDTQKDFIDLGACSFVVYFTRKAPDFEPAEYCHKFGEDGGSLPQLMYDKLRKQIFFVGGDYFIDTTNEVSPGIEN